jgi:glucose-6-phosphate 1-epimerase
VWDCVSQQSDSVVMQLSDSVATQGIWPHAFKLLLQITLTDWSLRMSLHIANTGQQRFSCTAALHTYLRISDVSSVQVQGLQGLRYRDCAANDAPEVQAAALSIRGEVDRIYFSAQRQLQLLDAAQHLQVEQRGFADAVVWNPGAAKAAELNDMEPDGYRHMLCIEAAAIETPITLEPGAVWQGMQLLSVVDGTAASKMELT